MAVDLEDLIESLRREVSGPGSVAPGTDAEYLGQLQDAFWHARLRGAFPGYEEEEGLVRNIADSSVNLPREQQQLIVLAAGLRIVRSALRNGGGNTMFRAKAGPVEFETQQSAQTLRELLVQLEREFKAALDEVTQGGASASTVAYFDAVIQRTFSEGEGSVWFVNG